MISTITATQIYKGVSPVIRKNVTHLFIYRLGNHGDLSAIVEEMSAIYDKHTLLQIYHEAIAEPYSFLCISPMQRDRSKMFMKRFEQYLIPS